MCTLVVLHRCVPGSPLVVAANRDEFLGRPAEGPRLRTTRTGPIVAPLDLEAGGTWVGVNARGVFAGLTNLRPPVAPDKTGNAGQDISLRSRGEVVMMALEAGSAAEAARRLSKLEEETYNPFQLLIADGHDARLLVYRGDPQITRLEAGPHIVGNVVDDRVSRALDTSKGQRTLTPEERPRLRKLTRIRERVEKLMTETGQDPFEGLAKICREHVGHRHGSEYESEDESERAWDDLSPFESTCVHVADRYGTRSSLLLALSEDPQANRFWTTEGPPCERSYKNRSSLLQELDVKLSNRVATETM
jgi:uncharacterized protein with NRDE domain